MCILHLHRSSLTCPHCLKQSNTFDPFLCVSLPIPLRQTRYVSIMLVNLTSILWNLWALQLQSYLLLLSQALLLGDIQWPNGMINVKGYWVPSVAAEGIINMLLFISPIARLPSLAYLEAGMGQLVPLKQTEVNQRKLVILCFPQLYF